MKDNKLSKSLAVVALLISVVGVSLGFAAYSNTLTIRAAADYTSPELHIPQLSTSTSSVTTGSVTPTVSGATADAATLAGQTISGLSVHFTNTNQSATYTFYAVNASAFATYLNTVTFGTKSCTPGTGTTASYVATACDDIIMTIAAGSSDYTETTDNISSHSIAANGYETVTVTIEYIDGGATADGPFDVSFGDSTLAYSTGD